MKQDTTRELAEYQQLKKDMKRFKILIRHKKQMFADAILQTYSQLYDAAFTKLKADFIESLNKTNKTNEN